MEKRSKGNPFECVVLTIVLLVCVVAYCAFLNSSIQPYETKSNTYGSYLWNLGYVKNRFDSTTYQHFRESYAFFEQTSKVKLSELQKQTDKDKAKVDSLEKALATLQKADEPVKVAPKPKMYRIKRIWQNSDTQPWTYNAYTSVYLRSSSYSGLFYSRHEATLKMGGKAQYVGDNRLDYVNVVFSDNSFRQFKIKDSPEWILAKEGELVKRDSDKFVPLFKK